MSMQISFSPELPENPDDVAEYEELEWFDLSGKSQQIFDHWHTTALAHTRAVEAWEEWVG